MSPARNRAGGRVGRRTLSAFELVCHIRESCVFLYLSRYGVESFLRGRYCLLLNWDHRISSDRSLRVDARLSLVLHATASDQNKAQDNARGLLCEPPGRVNTRLEQQRMWPGLPMPTAFALSKTSSALRCPWHSHPVPVYARAFKYQALFRRRACTRSLRQQLFYLPHRA